MAVWIDDAALDEEERKVREIVTEHLRRERQADRLPPQIRSGFDIQFDEDSEGDLAIQVWLHVADKGLPPREDASRLAKLTLAIQRELSGAGLRHWTNVSVRPGP